MDKKRAMIAASVAGLLAAVSVIGATAAQAADEKLVPCYGINKCKGAGDCGGKAGNACAGKNACKGAGFVKLSEKDCLRIEGGSLTPKA